VVVGHARVAVEPLSPLQPIHVLVVVSQNAVEPVHAVALVAEHCLHVPATHTGALAEQRKLPVPPRSPSQPTHVPVVVLQNAVAPAHAVVLVAEH